MFKPTPLSSGFDHAKGQCQTKAFLPKDMNLILGATALVSISHRIQPHSSVDSMKKYSMHHDMVMQGMNRGFFWIPITEDNRVVKALSLRSKGSEFDLPVEVFGGENC